MTEPDPNMTNPTLEARELAAWLKDQAHAAIVMRSYELGERYTKAAALIEALSQPRPLPGRELTDDQIKHMVERFLAWRLPDGFNPDGGISFKREFNENTAFPMKHEPRGTNLFDANQADKMVRYIVAGLPEGPDNNDAVGCAEREVARYVYKLIEARMGAQPGTPEGDELAYLAGIVADVEEYGAEKGSVRDLLSPNPDSRTGAGEGWQPIETAPKDGTRLWAFQNGDQYVAWWARFDADDVEDWQDDWDSEPSPTHWMPLPDPPAPGRDEEGVG